jgi:hypothetical protein
MEYKAGQQKYFCILIILDKAGEVGPVAQATNPGVGEGSPKGDVRIKWDEDHPIG